MKSLKLISLAIAILLCVLAAAQDTSASELAKDGMAYDEQGYRAEFIRLIEASNTL